MFISNEVIGLSSRVLTRLVFLSVLVIDLAKLPFLLPFLYTRLAKIKTSFLIVIRLNMLFSSML